MDPPYLCNSCISFLSCFLLPASPCAASLISALPLQNISWLVCNIATRWRRACLCLCVLQQERREETRGGFIPMSGFADILQRVKRPAVVKLYCLQCQLPVLSSSISFPSSGSLWDWGSSLFF